MHACTTNATHRRDSVVSKLRSADSSVNQPESPFAIRSRLTGVSFALQGKRLGDEAVSPDMPLPTLPPSTYYVLHACTHACCFACFQWHFTVVPNWLYPVLLLSLSMQTSEIQSMSWNRWSSTLNLLWRQWSPYWTSLIPVVDTCCYLWDVYSGRIEDESRSFILGEFVNERVCGLWVGC